MALLFEKVTIDAFIDKEAGGFVISCLTID